MSKVNDPLVIASIMTFVFQEQSQESNAVFIKQNHQGRESDGWMDGWMSTVAMVINFQISMRGKKMLCQLH